MNLIKKFFIFILLFWVGQNIYANEIIMKIYPSSRFVIPIHNGRDVKPLSLMNTFLEGFDFQNDQVEFFSKNSPWNANATFLLGNLTLDSEMLMQELKNKNIDYYPLFFHRQLNFLTLDDHLEIFLYDENDENPIKIDLPSGMADKILRYMSNDLEDKNRDCYDFFNEVFCLNSENIDITPRLSDRINKVRPGDGVLIYHKNENGNVDRKHFAIALGNNIYISKIGKGNFIGITDLKTLIDNYNCNYVCFDFKIINPNDSNRIFDTIAFYFLCNNLSSIE
ncbi:hypothetical protein K9M16_00870 [Candidatus Babeliales bacterium]|nr:hypothetical protein [Candidatus Babeliales bacterium]